MFSAVRLVVFSIQIYWKLHRFAQSQPNLLVHCARYVSTWDLGHGTWDMTNIPTYFQGDSGSALTVVEADNIPTQIGVTTFISGLGCAPGRPAVFARLNFYLLWISRMTNIVISNEFVF